MRIYSKMYIKDKEKHNFKNPQLLDYWMKDVKKETINHDNQNPQKTYNKINNLSKIKLNSASKIKK